MNRSAAERRQAYATSALLAAAAVVLIASIPLFDISRPTMLTLLLLAVVVACLMSALSVLLLLKVLGLVGTRWRGAVYCMQYTS